MYDTVEQGQNKNLDAPEWYLKVNEVYTDDKRTLYSEYVHVGIIKRDANSWNILKNYLYNGSYTIDLASDIYTRSQNHVNWRLAAYRVLKSDVRSFDSTYV